MSTKETKVVGAAKDNDGIKEEIFKLLLPDENNLISIQKIKTILSDAGINEYNTAVQGLFEKIALLDESDTKLNFSRLSELLKDGSSFLLKCLQSKLIVPSFNIFCEEIKTLYDAVKLNNGGHVATYIPQLARVDPKNFAISICTIDGQMYSIGDADRFFCIQSGCKPINYCLIQEEHGEDVVHQYIGKEPSGVSFNTLSLNEHNLPHNPLINAGAIMACALLKNDIDHSDRFDFLMNRWKALCGDLIVPRFNNAVYLSEKSTADRNYAIGHFLREKHAFPIGIKLSDVLEFYFQSCSIEVNTKAVSVAAATLANAGTCPLTQAEIFHPNHVKNCLSLMLSCGMYDYSGEFAFTIGLPAKSGVSGILYVVIPNLMGIAIWSPALDNIGNSVRGIDFCSRLIKRFNLHMFDTLVRNYEKIDPRYPLDKINKI